MVIGFILGVINVALSSIFYLFVSFIVNWVILMY